MPWLMISPRLSRTIIAMLRMNVRMTGQTIFKTDLVMEKPYLVEDAKEIHPTWLLSLTILSFFVEAHE